MQLGPAQGQHQGPWPLSSSRVEVFLPVLRSLQGSLGTPAPNQTPSNIIPRCLLVERKQHSSRV